jgi:hypothetical protein
MGKPRTQNEEYLHRPASRTLDCEPRRVRTMMKIGGRFSTGGSDDYRFTGHHRFSPRSAHHALDQYVPAVGAID